MAGEQFAVALKRFGDAASVMHRPDEDARGLLGSGARAALAFGLQLHTEGMPQDRHG
jgi:hypothetical protein